MKTLKAFETRILDTLRTKGAALLGEVLVTHPDQFFAVLRTLDPLFQVPDGPLIVTLFDDVQEVLERPTIFSVRGYVPKMEPTLGPFMLCRDGTTYNERDKGIMRALIRQEDLPNVRATVARLARRAIDEGAKGGRLEVVSKLSRRVPVELTGEYFGFPGPDIETMMRWSRAAQHDMFHNLEDDPVVHALNVQAGREMRAYLAEMLPARRKEIEQDPGRDDIASRLLRMRFPDVIGFDEERIQSNIMGTLVGHVETTSAAIVQLLDQLLDRPAELAGARQAAEQGDDQRLYKYCWEALRFNPINPFLVRYCEADYRIASGTLRATTVKAGTVVFVSTRSAMRDRNELPDPEDFRLDRPAHHYMHLGYGLHTCLGDHVSRVQVPEIVKQLLLTPDLRRAPGADGKIYMPSDDFPESFWVELG
jgi:cytochrome P450